jgi:hypothetical protein
MAVDGVMLDVPDTSENEAEFGRMSHKGRPDPFPQVRIVGLGECGTHAIVAAACDSWRVYERELFEWVLDEGLELGMLVLADRGFYSYEMWCQAVDAGAELVWRVKGGVELPVVEWLADGSYRSYLLPAQVKAAFKQGRSLRRAEALRREVRVVRYRVTNRSGAEEIIRLVTSIMDHELAPAAELAALYAQRWEFELTLPSVSRSSEARSDLESLA